MHLGEENPNTELFSGKQTPERSDAKVGPGGTVVCKLNQASQAAWQDEREVQVEAACAEGRGITVPLWTFLAEQHLAPHIVLPPPHY